MVMYVNAGTVEAINFWNGNQLRYGNNNIFKPRSNILEGQVIRVTTFDFPPFIFKETINGKVKVSMICW